jgi:hypothetical protein
MAVTLEQFVKQLADSVVIAPGKLEAFVPPKATPKDAQELARQLVKSHRLTKFHRGRSSARLHSRGRAVAVRSQLQESD